MEYVLRMILHFLTIYEPYVLNTIMVYTIYGTLMSLVLKWGEMIVKQ